MGRLAPRPSAADVKVPGVNVEGVEGPRPAERLSPTALCWWVTAAAAVVHVLAALAGGLALAGQSVAVALAGLAGVVLLGSWRGRAMVAAGIAVLAVNVSGAAGDDDVRHTLEPFYAPLSASKPYSAAEDLSWLGDSLAAQLSAHWPALLSIVLVCAGLVSALHALPRSGSRWGRPVAWTVVGLMTMLVLAGTGGAPVRWLVSVGAMVPTMVAIAAALAVLVAAADRGWSVSVPASLGALLLAATILGAELSQVGPIRPIVLIELDGFLDDLSAKRTDAGERAIAIAPSMFAIGRGTSEGFGTAPIMALLPVIAFALLVLAVGRRRHPPEGVTVAPPAGHLAD